jgi:hypothetical protein
MKRRATVRGAWLCVVVAVASSLSHAAAQSGTELPKATSEVPVALPKAAPALDSKPAKPRADKPARGAQTAGKQAGASAGKKGGSARREKPPRKKTAYDLLREEWHAPAPEDLCAQVRNAPVPDLVFRPHGKDTSYVLRPNSRQGGFDEAQLEIAKEAFGSWGKGPTPHPRTLDLVYAATLHFGAPYVTLISGVRKDRGGSRHSHGLAADIVLPGVDDEELAAFFRAQGFVGVGTYPHSGFVHVDTRDQSYFWIDNSRPNQRGRVVRVRAEEARQVDAAAVARGSATFVNPPRLQKALNVRLARRRRVRSAKLDREAARAAQTSSAP